MPYLRAKIFDTTYDCRAACGRLVRFSLAIGLLALVVPFDVKGQDTQDDLETLKSIEDELSRAQDAQSERMRDRSALEQDALTIQNELVETARAIQELEQELTLSEIRLTELIEEEERVTSQLAERRHDIAELLGGMQILARQNPPALLVSPDDAVRAVRSAILLEDVTPEFLERANQLERELVQLKAVREQIIAEQAQLSARYAAFEDQDEVLRGLLAERQTARAALSEMILSEERRIGDLGGHA